jgi:L-amino acid N-acyltransferase YncA
VRKACAARYGAPRSADCGTEGAQAALLGIIALPNRASIALHEKLGFKKIGHFAEVGWKFGHWVDVGYWQLIL